ncbi:MAG: PIN domain-containing protein [Haloferacaceae archaeon]
MLLDSTFIHDLLREDEGAVATLQELVDDGTPVTISPVTVYEVGVGLRGDAAGLRGRFWGVVDDLETAPLGVRQAERALAIQHRLLDRGERIGAVDVLLAGTAATLSDPRVLTRNVGEFERVDAIDVETY